MEQDLASIDFLYDFVYLDRPRAQSWLAQLIAEGVPVSTKYSGSVTKSKMVTGAGGVPGFASGGGSATNSAADTHERHYNSEWSLPLVLLDVLDEHGYIHRSISEAQIGSLVLVSGQLQVTDIGLLQKNWTPFMKLQTMRAQNDKAAREHWNKFKGHIAPFGEVITTLPPNPHAYITDDHGEVFWSALREDGMAINTGTIALSHGASIPGRWNMLATLDATPTDIQDDESAELMLGSAGLGKALAGVMNMVKTVAGRKNTHFAATPIMIFRETVPQSSGARRAANS